ncbi:glycosyltransferase family 4 protein [Salinarchaeum chitinilyticum]
MRVLYLTEEPISFTDAMVRGGAIHVRNVVEGLRERGHEVHLVDWNDSPERPFQHSIQPKTRFVDGPLRTTRRAIEVARAEDVDVIVSKTRKTYLAGLVAARRVGVPHVAHVGALPEATGGSLFDRLDAASFRTRLRAPHDGYFVVCEAIATVLTELGVAADRIYDVKNAVDMDVFSPGAASDHPTWLQNAVDDAGDSFVLGYVGGLHEYKGVRDIPLAIEQSEADIQLLVAGGGPERERLADELGDQGTFLGSVPYDAMPAVYDVMDALVLPSYTEGLPRVVLEAQAMEVPVIASRVGGVPEVVDDGETGMLYEPGNVAELGNALEELASNPDRCRSIGRTGRGSVVDQWSWEQLYDRYERYLEQVGG